MSYQVSLNQSIKPNVKPFAVEHQEAILEAALRAGLNVAYGCNNGNCGLCAARLRRGQLRKIKDADYVFASSQKAQNYFLMCAHTAASDLHVEAELAEHGEQIPRQRFRAKLAKVNPLGDQLAQLRMRVSRSHRLRFLAGQSVSLKHQDYAAQRLAIASCPCDSTELEFHIRCAAGELSRRLCVQYRLGEWFEVEGPYGRFTFSESRERPLLLIACDHGFAALKSLIEHVVAQESERPLHLYRASWQLPIYMENLCFAWRDALDQFAYSRLPSVTDGRRAAALWVEQLVADHPQLAAMDCYLCLPSALLAATKSALSDHGASAARIFCQAA